MAFAFVPVPRVLDDGSFFDGPKPLCVNEYPGKAKGITSKAYSATESASASASLTLRISSARSSSEDFRSRLYQ